MGAGPIPRNRAAGVRFLRRPSGRSQLRSARRLHRIERRLFRGQRDVPLRAERYAEPGGEPGPYYVSGNRQSSEQSLSTWRWPISFNAFAQNRARRVKALRVFAGAVDLSRRALCASVKSFATCVLTAALAIGGTVSGRVEIVSSQDPDVRKHSDYSGVVVWLDPLAGAPAITNHGPKKAEMLQKGKRFLPHLLAISVGTTVRFSQLRSHLSQRLFQLRRPDLRRRPVPAWYHPVHRIQARGHRSRIL